MNSVSNNPLMNKANDLLLRAYMDSKKIPYMTVGDSNIERIEKYLLENKIMPYHCVPEHVARKHGLVDNGPNLSEVIRETKRLQELANKARGSK